MRPSSRAAISPPRSGPVPESRVSEELAKLDIQPSAGYVDGHVESFTPADTVPMRAILRPETGEPYDDDADYSPGIFYLPRIGLR